MPFRAAQPNFSKGILTKELWGRADIAPYSAGVRQGLNAIILKYGGLTKRPGTRLVYEIRDGADKRLIPFEGAFGASYAMLMGQATMRLAASGGMVIEDKLTVEGVTLDDPVQVTVSYHGFSDGDEVFFSGVEGAEWLNGRIEVVTVIDEHNFTVPVNGTLYDEEFTGDTGGALPRTGAPDPAPTPPTVPPEAPELEDPTPPNYTHYLGRPWRPDL